MFYRALTYGLLLATGTAALAGSATTTSSDAILDVFRQMDASDSVIPSIGEARQLIEFCEADKEHHGEAAYLLFRLARYVGDFQIDNTRNEKAELLRVAAASGHKAAKAWLAGLELNSEIETDNVIQWPGSRYEARPAIFRATQRLR